MKTKTKTAVTSILLAMICLVGCETKTTPQKNTVEQSNKDYNIILLFEVDGIKVYRFSDGLRNVYFSNAQGRIDYDYTRRAGTSVTQHTQTTLTNNNLGNKQ